MPEGFFLTAVFAFIIRLLIFRQKVKITVLPDEKEDGNE